MKAFPRLLAGLAGLSCAIAACSSPTAPSPSPAASDASTAGSVVTSTPATAPAPTTTASPMAAATSYSTTVVHRGADHPDDLTIDATGALLYSDYTNGTITRLAPDGTTKVLHRGLDGPEGLVLLRDGTLVVAEENTNRVLAFAPGAASPHMLVTLPGQPVKATCHQGVDGIAWDATTGTLVVPDPVTGTIYRVGATDGSLTRIASWFVHPVGAAVDSHGRVYVADECGGDVWRLDAGNTRTRVARASMPDDVAIDAHGNVLVTDVRHVDHDLRRWPLSGGAPTVLASDGLVEPQGLVIDSHGRIYVSDDRANVILRLTPRV